MHGFFYGWFESFRVDKKTSALRMVKQRHNQHSQDQLGLCHNCQDYDPSEGLC
jgi:hypothetical protein